MPAPRRPSYFTSLGRRYSTGLGACLALSFSRFCEAEPASDWAKSLDKTISLYSFTFHSWPSSPLALLAWIDWLTKSASMSLWLLLGD